MQINFIILFLAALVPILLGFVWYNPRVFGHAWIREAGMTEEKTKGANMAKTFLSTYFLSLLAAFGINFMVVHQWHVFSILLDEPGFGDPDSEIGAYFRDFMDHYSHNFRSFGHGMLHGLLGGVMVVWPPLAVNAIFERKSAKYIAINAGFWIVCFGVMGGIICRWL